MSGQPNAVALQGILLNALGPANTLNRHQSGLPSYFAHPITNAGAEGLNSRI